MKLGLLALVVAFSVSSCTTSYPYLITTNHCNCERFVYKDEGGRFELEVSAHYVVTDRISTAVDFTIRNRSRDSLSLRQAYLKATSSNVRYQANGQFQPMPYVLVPPAGEYTLTLQGSDTQADDNPWLKIAGEQVEIEIRGIMLGTTSVSPITITLIPFNPKLTSQ